MKHKLNFMNDPPVAEEDNFNKDYKVADFGVDEDVKNVRAAIGNAEVRLGQKMSADFGATAPDVATPRNYFVPNFGVDDEILYTKNNIKNSEKQFGRKLNVSFDQNSNPVNPRGYPVPDFGLD
jgi:hypothetical protein